MRTSSIKRLAKVIGTILLCCVLLSCGVLLWLAKTESGLRWALNRAPDLVTVSDVSGELSDLSFSNLVLSLDGTQVKIASGEIKWDMTDLFSKRFSVRELKVNDLQVRITTPVTPSQEMVFQSWQGIDLPIDIAINNIEIRRIGVIADEQQLAEVERLTAQLDITRNLLELSRLSVLEKDNRVDITGRIDLSAEADGEVNISNTVQWAIDQEQQIDIAGSIVGTWSSLDIIQRSAMPLVSSVKLNVENVLAKKISWKGSLQTQARTVQANAEQTINLGQGEFDLSGEMIQGLGLPGLQARVSGAIIGANEQFSSWSLVTDVEFNDDALRISQLDLSETPLSSDAIAAEEGAERVIKPGELSVAGSISGVSNFLQGHNGSNARADLIGDWRELGWPISGDEKQVTTSGNFKLIGVPDNFSFIGKATGESYDKPIIADATIQFVDKVIDIKALKLNSGASRIDIAGNFGDNLALQWDIASPDLSELLPGLAGDLISKGKLSGKISAPKFNASAKSKRIEYADFKINNLELKANGALSATLDAIEVEASIVGIEQAADQLAEDLIIAINGTGKAHNLRVSSNLLGESNLLLNVQGGLTENGWLGVLENFSLDTPAYGKWALAKAVELELKDTKFRSEKACLSNVEQNVCVMLVADDAGVVASGEINALELNSFDPLLSLYDLSLSGQLNGKLDYTKQSGRKDSEIFAELAAQNSVLSVKQAKASTKTLSITSANIEIKQQLTLVAKALLLLENDDQVSLEFEVASALESAKFANANLKGRIFAELKDLSKLQAVIPQVTELGGSLDADINLAGSISTPTLSMQTHLSNGQCKVPVLGLDLSQIEVIASSLGKQEISLQGSLVSGQGQLIIDGDLDFTQLDQPHASISLKGDNMELMKTAEIHVDGDVNTLLVINNELIDVSGDIKLVQADLDFQLPENAILASDDVVLLGEEKVQPNVQQKIKLKLDLGKQTHIRAKGLDAYLVGSLEIEQEPGGVMRGFGQIDIKDGGYAAYNQKLKIDKGQLIFNGSSIDDPSLLLRAQKSVDSLTAGVSVTGRASSPILQLYSTPTLSDQDILSVLIFNKPIGDLGSQDGLTLLRIANSLRGDGTSKSQVDTLTASIQETLGLSNLELQLNGNSPSLVAGKQLSSKFYVGYGYGLLDAAQSLILRYKVSQAWSIQGDVGADSGADLRYQIER